MKVFPIFIFGGIFVYVLFNIPYPESITQATLFQLIIFFIPLFLAIMFTLNIFFRNILISGSASLGIILLLILKALDSLNLITGVLVIISIGLLISYFRKLKRKNLTNWRKIPKLTNLRRKKHE